MNKPHIGIVGASFAGLSAYLALRKRLGDSISITLLDKREDFTYICALHETLFAPEKLSSMQFHLPKYYKEYKKAKVSKITNEKIIELETGEKINCDYIVIATGSGVNYFGNESLQEYTLPLRRAEDVTPLNQRLDSAKDIVVIGGGFTGVEIAATIAQKKKSHQTISLIDAENRLFHHFVPKVGEKIQNWLTSHGVKLYLGAFAESASTNSVSLSDGSSVSSDCTILSSGISINNQTYASELTFTDGYSAQQNKDVYVCGDNTPAGLHTTAHNAMIEGRRVGNLIADNIQGITNTYKPLVSREILALALGTRDGMFTNKKNATYIPFLTGLSKKIVEKRIMFEFKHKIMLWV